MLHKFNNMKKNKFQFILSAAILTLSLNVSGRENVGGRSAIAPAPDQYRDMMSACTPATAQTDLDINNVRATLLTGGDMWWNLVDGRYLVPKPPQGEVGPTALYAGSLWIGGFDNGGQLKVAAMTYRQTGNDFWPGPLDNSAATDAAVCSQWDKHFKVNRKDAEDYYNWVAAGQLGANPVSASGMDAINNWPATGPLGQPMAPFYDVNGNGIYEPWLGEVPDFDVTGTRGCNASLFGDQSLFWVFNDKGNIHTETGGAAIGLEIQAQAFAFATSDEINNMTFYRYKIINKSTFTLDSTFFGVWVDADLGSANDDYVGCDVGLGLGYCYNGDLVDDNPPAGQIPYGGNPPAIGIDFFEGPFADPNGIDDPFTSVPASFLNYGDTTIDNERIGMKKFVYYNNDNTFTGNPDGAVDVYNYLTGTWKDGTAIQYGGNGHLTGGIQCDYMFPGDTDPNGFGTNGIPQAPWTEALVGNVPADRRFLQSAGPFTLLPGAVNTITTGAVWARASQGGNLASVALMKGADTKAQRLFDNCFATLDGPTAPSLAIQELDRELILTWTNPEVGTNNVDEQYAEDPNKAKPGDVPYTFQGYIIYQLRDGSVGASDLYDVNKARVVFQCDIKDGVSQIVNYYNDVTLSALVPKEMVNGANQGIVHSASIKEDKFAVGDNRLVNHKTYYYTIVAYGHTPKPIADDFDANLLDDYLPFIAGRKNADFGNVFVPRSAIPHIPSPEAGGTAANSTYGMGPKMTRIEGQGNGGNILDFTSETVARILSSPSSRVIDPTYENGRGPVNVKVIDPLNVPEGDFELRIFDTISPESIDSTAIWSLTNLTTNTTVTADRTIYLPNEQIINGQVVSNAVTMPKWGISVTGIFVREIGNTNSAGTQTEPKNSFLEATMTFADASKQWLSGLQDAEGTSDQNWIRAGSETVSPYDDRNGDQFGDYEKVLNGTWAPYSLTAYTLTTGGVTAQGGPAWHKFQNLSLLKNTASVDIVFTSDKSKWTRCPVIELQESNLLAEGGANKMDMRKAPSVDKQGRKAGESGYNAAEGDLNGTTGMGWFPGYALNLETGERLNMAFGEDSYLTSENGRDMKWNPTPSLFSPTFEPVFGGKHYIYVFGHNGDRTYTADPILGTGLRDIPRYDGGKVMHDLFAAAATVGSTTSAGEAYKREVYADAMWVNIPLANSGHPTSETDVKVRLRVAKPYMKGYTGSTTPIIDTAATPANRNFGLYRFNTSDIVTKKNDATTAEEALALINIVPNPYYAYSSYETSALDNIVKITNLPDQCTVSIYTLNGTLIRKFKKDDTKTSLDWDLKNQARIPIASGLYIIHVDVPNVGEKILKWFGVVRPIDLDQY
jgi:hypothetical protein